MWYIAAGNKEECQLSADHQLVLCAMNHRLGTTRLVVSREIWVSRLLILFLTAIALL